METIKVQGAPSIYQCYEGVLKQLPEQLSGYGFKQAALLHGEKSWEASKDYLKVLSIPTTSLKYQGECTHEEVERLKNKMMDCQADVLLAVGGGKILDLAKACGNALDIPVILIPTLASNCAAWTPLSVFYDQSGNFLEYIVYPKSTFMVLVEPRIILESPKSYFRAGIGDTIAKWYEADVLTRDMVSKPIPLEIALHAAKLCRDVLLKNGSKGLEAMDKKDNTEAFLQSVETIIMAGGMVGGFGDQYGRISGAHSIHNGLTTIAETHTYLHGEKVAYGILVQLALENRMDEIDFLIPYYKELNLPKSLSDVGIIQDIDTAIHTIAENAVKPGESIHFMNVSQKRQVYDAINTLESYVLNTSVRS